MIDESSPDPEPDRDLFVHSPDFRIGKDWTGSYIGSARGWNILGR